MKRTTLMVDAELLEQARRQLGARTYSEAVDVSLREALRRQKVLGLKDLFGADFWDGDLDTMRRARFSPARKSANGKRR